MFLLHINKYKLKKIKYYKNLSEKVKNDIKLLKKIKEYHLIKNLQNIIVKKSFKSSYYKSNFFIKYVLGVIVTKTNTIIYLTDIKGRIKYFITSGILKINEKQNKAIVISKLFRFLLLKNMHLQKTNEIVLHFKNLNQRLALIVFSFVSKYFQNILAVKIYNNQPHNGCRPKKIKRKKRKKLVFTKRRNV